MFESLISIPFIVPFVSTSNTTGLVSFAGVHLLKNGVSVSTPTITYAEIGNGLYTAQYTPSSTGIYTLFIETKIQATINVVAKLTSTFIQNIEDEALGSWVWDKNAGTVLFKRQDGTTMAGFDVVDNLTTASRERTTP